MELLDILNLLITAAAGIVGTIKGADLLRKRQLVIRFLKTTRRKINGLNKLMFMPTRWGITFICLILLSLILSATKDWNDSKEKRKWQQDVVNMSVSNQKASKRYERKLEGFAVSLDSAYTKYLAMHNNYLVQLNKWGLTIKDSMIVKKTGEPSLGPQVGYPVVIDSSVKHGDMVMNFYSIPLCNHGDATAYNVNVKVYAIYKLHGKLYRYKDLFVNVRGIELTNGLCFNLSNQEISKDEKVELGQYYVMVGTYTNSQQKTIQKFGYCFTYNRYVQHWITSFDINPATVENIQVY